MNTNSSQTSASVATTLTPVMAAVLAGFLVIGVALPVLPLHVHDDLRFGTFMVGLVAGSQFAASLLSRVWAGGFADRRGARLAVLLGLIGAAVSGGLYVLSLAFTATPVLSVAVLLAGRALLGAAESFIITGGVSWGLGLVDREHAGKVIAWVGTAMFLALAMGGPVGTTIFDAGGFLAIALLTAALPILVLVSLLRTKDSAPPRQTQTSSLRAVAPFVWLPGFGAALSSIGYCAILAFSSLYYAGQGWHPVWLAFTAFGGALILARLVLGHVPDKTGGAKTALVFVVVLAAGLLVVGLAGSALVATAGAALAGLGYSLVYPGLGIEAVRDALPEQRGMAMGLYTAFLDLAMGVGSPALGLVASHAGLGSVFLVSAFVVLATVPVAVRLQRMPHRLQPMPGRSGAT